MSNQDIVTVEPQTPVTKMVPLPIETFIAQAIDKGLPVETMEKFLTMRRELRAEAAKESFDHAMADFQAKCPTIEKTKEVVIKGDVAYRYAPIESIVEQVKDLLGKNGLSYVFHTKMTDTHVEVNCTIKHLFGHADTTQVVMPLATRTGVMSAPQQVAATLTFGKRYAFCNALGIMTGDEDTDAVHVEEKPRPTLQVSPQTNQPPKQIYNAKDPSRLATEAQLKMLHVFLDKYGMPAEAFKQYMKVTSTKELTMDKASKTIETLMQRVNAGEKWQAPKPTKQNMEITSADIQAVDVKSETVTIDEIVDSFPKDMGGKTEIIKTCEVNIAGKLCGRPSPCAYHPNV